MKFFFLLLTSLSVTYCAGQAKVHQSRKLVWADELINPAHRTRLSGIMTWETAVLAYVDGETMKNSFTPAMQKMFG